MAKPKKQIRRRRKNTISLAIAAPIAAQLAVGVWPRLKVGNIEGATNEILRDYTGFDIIAKNWDASRMRSGALPVAVGAMVHKVANMLGVNSALARAGIRWIRI